MFTRSYLFLLCCLTVTASRDICRADDNDVVLVDGFVGNLDGPLMPMVGPTPEYHFVHEMITDGKWLVTAFGSHPQDQVGWRIVRTGERKDLSFLHTSSDKHWHPTVATGDHDWRDYTVSLQLVPKSKRGRCGITVRSENDRCYVFVGLDNSSASLIRVRHEVAFREPGEAVLAEQPISRVPGEPISMIVTVKGNDLTAKIGDISLTCDLTNDPIGGVGLQTDGPAVFRSVKIECSADEFARMEKVRANRQAEVDAIAERYPKPKLWKVIQTKGFGCDRNIRFGDLTGDGRNEIVFGQILHHGPRDSNSEVSCLTAVDLDGKTLWTVGTPDRYRHHLTNDVGFQVHDLDGDGKAEVIYCKDQEIRVANGMTGETIRKVPTPTNPNRKPPANMFPRILGDCLTFADLSGQGRATDLMIKDRYGNLWAYNSELNPLWNINCNTGHFPFPIDLDHDGKDEVFVGYSLVDSDGTFLWTRDDQFEDHADAIAVMDLDGDERVEVLWAGSDEGLIWLGEEGIPRTHLRLGHTQNLTIADLRPELPGLEVAVVNFWKNQGLLHIIDAQGNVVESLEPRADHGSAMPAVNWAGDNRELLFVNPDPRFGGLMDGHGRFIVRLPSDGHPTLAYDAIDLTGDVRDELVVWDSRELWIYTADDSPSAAPLQSRKRNPRYNESNYRSRISIPQP